MQCSARSVGGIGREKGGMGQKIHGEGESEKERERERENGEKEDAVSKASL